jgi:hypothetical protein
MAREQHYIDTLKPEYNILKEARSRLGSSHTDETKAKIKAANIGVLRQKTRRLKNPNVFILQTPKAIPGTITDTFTNVTQT